MKNMEMIKRKLKIRKAISDQEKLKEQLLNRKNLAVAVEGAIEKQRKLAGLK